MLYCYHSAVSSQTSQAGWACLAPWLWCNASLGQSFSSDLHTQLVSRRNRFYSVRPHQSRSPPNPQQRADISYIQLVWCSVVIRQNQCTAKCKVFVTNSEKSRLEINRKKNYKLRIFNLIVLRLERTSVFEKYTFVFFQNFLSTLTKQPSRGQCPPVSPPGRRKQFLVSDFPSKSAVQRPALCHSRQRERGEGLRLAPGLRLASNPRVPDVVKQD